MFICCAGLSLTEDVPTISGQVTRRLCAPQVAGVVSFGDRHRCIEKQQRVKYRPMWAQNGGAWAGAGQSIVCLKLCASV